MVWRRVQSAHHKLTHYRWAFPLPAYILTWKLHSNLLQRLIHYIPPLWNVPICSLLIPVYNLHFNMYSILFCFVLGVPVSYYHYFESNRGECISSLGFVLLLCCTGHKKTYYYAENSTGESSRSVYKAFPTDELRMRYICVNTGFLLLFLSSKHRTASTGTREWPLSTIKSVCHLHSHCFVPPLCFLLPL